MSTELTEVLEYFRHQVQTGHDPMLLNREARLLLEEFDRRGSRQGDLFGYSSTSNASQP